MQPVSTHFHRLVALAVPTTLAQLGMMFLQVVDVVMLGRVGVEEIGAASLGRVWILGTIVVAMGLLFGIDPVASQAYGAGRRDRLVATLGHGLALAVWLTPLVALFWMIGGPALSVMGQQPELVELAHAYILWQLPGLPFFLGFIVLKQYLQSQGIVQPAMWVTLGGNLLNVAVNWVLIFGLWGVPALGVVGAAIATSITNLFLFATLATWMHLRARPAGGWAAVSVAARDRSGIREIVRFGGPVGALLALEMWAFQLATLFAGWLGAVSLAAHTVALTIASLTFMLPLGVSIAACVRVGNLIGAGKPRDAQRASWVAFALGAGVMAITAVVFLVGRFRLPRLFSADPEVVLAASVVLPIAAAFQVFDGTQVVGTGILRGMGQTRPAAVFNFVGYYVLALPAAWWLGFELELGLAGVWWGLTLGLFTVALLLLWWVARYGPGAMATWVREDDT